MQTEIRFEPTLFIFLGTSSAQIGWRLKDLLRKAYGDVPILRFLWVDADSTVDPYISSWFLPVERVELTGFNGDAVLANINNFPAIRSWWNREARLKAGFINRGAGQMRPIGRLSLFRMYNDRNAGPAFIDKLRVACESIQQIENIDATERMTNDGMRFIVERGSARVVIFFSTCGGTGSSMSFDLAYLCRHLLREVNPTLLSVALLPSIMDKAIKNETPTQRERIRANTYAWFKESGYLIENPHWNVAYPEGAPLNVQAPPFDMNFVVDIGNQAGNRLNSEDDIFNMIAAAVFLDTGSSIGGAIRGFNANVSVLLDEYQGKRRAYSSLAAASLVYPVDKILGYSSARLGQAIIRDACLANPDPRETAEVAAALLGRLHLRDEQVLEDLLNGHQVGSLNVPAIRKSENVEEIRRLLALQEESNAREREYLKGRMGEKTQGLLRQATQQLGQEVFELVMRRGVRFAQAVLNHLITETATLEHVPDTTRSLYGFKTRLGQLGTNEANLMQVEQNYVKAREHLRAMSGDAIRSAQRTFFKKAWLEGVNRARNDCLTWMGEFNSQTLQLHAQRQAANLYEQLGDQARKLKSTVSVIQQTLGRVVDRLEEIASNHLKPTSADHEIYELTVEAVGTDYIESFHHSHVTALDPAAVYQSFGECAGTESLDHLASWSEGEWTERLKSHARTYFLQEVEQTSLLQAMSQFYGRQAPHKIEEQFNRLVRYCHPFWQYDANSGIQGQEGKSIIGIEDEHSDLIPQKYRDDPQYEVKSTGFKHRIDFARVQHGLPAFLLRDMHDYKAYYDLKRKGLDPLHVFPDAFHADEVIPEEKLEARHIFASAAAFGYVIQVGTFYYFDPEKEYVNRNIRPQREFRLDQGREKAEDAFVQRDDFLRTSEGLIERDIVNMGNQAAIRLLEERIAEYKQALSRMAPDGDLRRQYEDEIRALAAKQQQLGKL
ncbi:MAG: tubulin-like doman-containing protein [Anaerolineales bacterium]|nr:MAG: tubulin-like doman-containing protein [Anaerolineales bacterium]